jgi:hypothetical protein
MAKCYNCLNISKGARDGGKGVGAKAPRNKNLEGLQDQELKEPTTRSKRNYD